MSKKALSGIVVFILLIVSLPCSAEEYIGPVLFEPQLTNRMYEKLALSSSGWMETEYSRALLTTLLVSDFTISDTNLYETEDVAVLDTTYVMENDGTLFVLVRGDRNYSNANILLMYTPADRDAAYTIYPKEMGTFAMLKHSLEGLYGKAIENNIEQMIDVGKNIMEIIGL